VLMHEGTVVWMKASTFDLKSEINLHPYEFANADIVAYEASPRTITFSGTVEG